MGCGVPSEAATQPLMGRYISWQPVVSASPRSAFPHKAARHYQLQSAMVEVSAVCSLDDILESLPTSARLTQHRRDFGFRA